MTDSKHRVDLQKQQLTAQYRAAQEAIRQQTAVLVKQWQTIHKEVEKQCAQIRQTAAQLQEKARQFASSCLKTVSQGEISRQVTDIQQLGSYLSLEKQLLKKVVEDSAAPSPQHHLHSLLTSSRLQGTLRSLRKAHLEEQIKFLESNVLVKGNLIYNPASSQPPAPAEQKQLNARVANHIAQLQRVIALSLPCQINEDHSHRLRALKAQEDRLKQCQIMLTNQQQKVSKLARYLGDFGTVIDRLPVPEYSGGQMSQEEEELYQLEVDEGELDELLQFKGGRQLVSRLEHPFAQMQENIEQLCRKSKKLQSML